MTHSEQQIDQINNASRTAMQEVSNMFQVLDWQDFLEYMLNALPMLLDREKNQIINAYKKADYDDFDGDNYAENYFNQTYNNDKETL